MAGQFDRHHIPLMVGGVEVGSVRLGFNSAGHYCYNL